MATKFIKGNHGFTLVELLVVVVILSIIAGIVGVSVRQHPDIARQKKAVIQITTFESVLDIYYTHMGDFPTTEQGLEVLAKNPELSGSENKWHGPYMKRIPKDPWKRIYIYRQPGSEGNDYDIICYGKDGVSGSWQ